jgi:hypothetical protein
VSAYRLTVDVELPDDMDDGTLHCLTSIVLTALHDASVSVRRVEVEKVGEQS